MAKIVFTWELGAGFGHIAPHIDIIKALQAKGHTVAFVLRDLSRAGLLLSQYKINYFQAPIKTSPIINPVKVPCTYAHILHNVGFDEVESLRGHIQGWRSLYEMIQPDLVLYDHSPTALIAARDYSFAKIVIGNGFFVPPVSPLPNLRFWLKLDENKLLKDELHTLAIINQALALHKLPQLSKITDIFEKTEQVLCTYEEIDQYKGRKNAKYYGTWPPSGGEKPIWPSGKGKKVFAYLKPFPSLPALLSTLNILKMPTIVYIDRLGENFKNKYKSPSLNFSDKPLDMNKIADECDFAIFNGTLGTTTTLLKAGKPALHLPIFLEQYLLSHNVEKMGGGVCAPTLKPEEITNKLNLLLSNDSYAKSAQAFAKKYAGLKKEQQINNIVGVIEKMLG
jgi:hypothetical protein